MIIDTHIHLYDSRYQDDLDNIINEAIENDVKKMIIVGYDYNSSLKAIEMAKEYDFMYAAVGLHPSEVKEENDIDWVKELVKFPKVIAIGEIGLDYYWDKTYQEQQKNVFIKQISIANEFNLPVIVHSRSASSDTYEILEKYRTRGVLHCYSSSLEMAREFVKIGYYLGIGGVLTFKNSKEIKDVVKEIDLKYILSETDGPYLAPSPFRGKLNKPSYLIYIIDEISKIKNIDVSLVKTILEQNTKDLFNI